MSGILETIEGFGGCFSPYMFICSITQGIYAYDRRSLQEQMSKDNMELEIMLNERHIRSDAEMIAHRRVWMQQRLNEMRRTRAEQNFALNNLQLSSIEVEAFIKEYLPICGNTIQPLIEMTDRYKKSGYAQESCPLQVLLLHTKHKELNKYIGVYDYLDGLKEQIKNVEFPRWCEDNAEQNTSILNLHAIMKNIPTAVISPYYQASTSQILFTIAMWEAQSDTKPLIVPVFSLECDPDCFLSKNSAKRDELIDKISKVSALLSGCVRDIYMLYAFGDKPTLPSVLSNNAELSAFFEDAQVSELKRVIINEYDVAAKSLNTQCDHIKSIASLASEAYSSLLKIQK